MLASSRWCLGVSLIGLPLRAKIIEAAILLGTGARMNHPIQPRE
jgi:hypothetical protein